MVINKEAIGGTPSSLRRVHRGIALRELLEAGQGSRASVAAKLGLSQMAASRIVRELLNAGLVEEAGISCRESGPGRHQTLLKIRPEGAYAAGIVFSGYSQEVAIVDATGALVAHKKVRASGRQEGAKVLARLGRALNLLIEKHAISKGQIIGVGVCLAANLDASRQRALSADYLGLEPFEVTEPIELATGLPVTAENITNALTLAETILGAAKGLKNVIIVRSATTIGATTLQHGEIVRGSTSRAGRIGHVRQRPTPLTCACGRRDCLNCTASGWSVLVRSEAVDDKYYDPRQAESYAVAIDRMTQADSLDPKIDGLIGNAGGALADVIHMLNQVAEPEAIVLAGAMARSPAYVHGISQRLAKLDDDGQATAAKISVGNMRAANAAGLLVLQKQVYSPSFDLSKFDRTEASAHRQQLRSQ